MGLLDFFRRKTNVSEPEFEFGLVENPEHEKDPRNVLYSEIALGQAAVNAEFGIKPQKLSLERPNVILNQGSSDSCVAHTGVHAYAQMTNKILSPRYAWKKMKEDPKYPSSGLSWGAYLLDVVKVMVDEGITTLDLLPNEHVNDSKAYRDFLISPAMERAAEDNRIGGYAFVLNGGDDLERFDAITTYLAQEKRSLLGSVTWRTSFNNARRGGVVPPQTPEGKAVGHAMAIDGYTKINGHEYLEYCNSWGQGWGNRGKLFLPKGFFRITGAIAMNPMIVRPEKKPQIVRNKAREQANALDMRNWLYARFPERMENGKVLFITNDDIRNAKIRGLAGSNWPLLVHAVTYLGYTHGDVYSWLEAQVDGKTLVKAYSFDFTKAR